MFRKKILQALSIGLVLLFTISLNGLAAAQLSADYQQNDENNEQNGHRFNQHNNNQQSNKNGNQCGSAAQFMADEEIMKGDENCNYNLSDYIVRGDMMILLVRAFNLHSNAGGRNFADLLSGDYYYDAVGTARDLGIAQGDGKNFMPGNYVTISEAILFIERAAKHAEVELDVDLESLYDEQTLSSYATREDVCELLYYVLTGNTDGFDGEYGNSYGSKTMTVSYSIGAGDVLTFIGSDFSDALENLKEDETISYVKFTTLPSSSNGVLYYEYDEDDDSNTTVSKNTSYDLSKLSNITFVPESDYDGTVTISYKVYTEEDNSYSGKIIISVGDTDITAETITYTTDENEAISFDGSDFSDACDDAGAGTFSYVKFASLPSYYGVLYYDYDEDNDSNIKVSKNTAYDAGELYDITFVPRIDTSGTVRFSYTGYTTQGATYTGIVQITVE